MLWHAKRTPAPGGGGGEGFTPQEGFALGQDVEGVVPPPPLVTPRLRCPPLSAIVLVHTFHKDPFDHLGFARVGHTGERVLFVCLHDYLCWSLALEREVGSLDRGVGGTEGSSAIFIAL